MENTKKISVTSLTWDEAAHAINAAGVVDPAGINTPGDIARGGHCYAFNCDGETCSYVVRVVGKTMVIDAAAATGTKNATAVGLELARRMALEIGCTAIQFETARPGLAKLALQHGYTSKSVLMEKKL